MPPDAKQAERAPIHYTMKTSSHGAAAAAVKAQMASSSQSHGTRHGKPSKATTPIASPRTPYSVGQNYAPKLSPARQHEPRAPSPNYFGLMIEAPNESRDSSGAMGRNNWSPPSSSIKSFNAAIPQHVPLDANPEFEAFKRQVDLNKGGRTFAPSTVSNTHLALNNPPARPRPSRWNTHASDAGSVGRSPGHARDKSLSKASGDQNSVHDSAYVSSDSKRNSQSSFQPPPQLGGGVPRFESPLQMEGPFQQQRSTLTRSEDRDPRLSLMEHRADPPSPAPGMQGRAATLSTHDDKSQSDMISGDKLRDMMKHMDSDDLLLLDIRSSQNYAHSRIEGALNLCVPTTLLKRATFNIQKLQQTFSNGPNSGKFSKWRETRAIVVYDSHASNMKDAATAYNMLKKFTGEGYSGETCILRGGFGAFRDMYPKLISSGSADQHAETTDQVGQAGGLAPVIGGVMLPTSSNAANPFFSNIRQNMDLADGVGQLEVARPDGLQSPSLPTWLRQATSVSDKGKQVSGKFLHIEREEKARMQNAYAQFDPRTRKKDCVQLCGVEKGGKNRYKDILPFEHARVKLEGRSAGSCDYINASHLTSARSNKRYIAAQGPLPATFEDFWSVVWEQDVRVIVMLTAESEGGQVKCHTYWQDRQFGPIRLKLLSEKKASLDIDKHRAESTVPQGSWGMSDHTRRRANTTTTLETPATNAQSAQSQTDNPFVSIRKFALSHTGHPFAPIREVTHLHYSAWPDFGTPARPAHLLALIELANVMQRAALPVETSSIVSSLRTADYPAWYDEAESNPQTRPMLVHCSAGCGRTGTFCAVDSVIDMLKRQRQAKHATSHTLKPQDIDGDITMDDPDGMVSPFTDSQMRWHGTSNNSQRRVAAGAEHLDTGFLKDDTVDLIQSTVEGFRTQRLSMVQSLRQFVLCYETILEWAHRINDRSTPHLIAGRARSGSLQQSRPDPI